MPPFALNALSLLAIAIAYGPLLVEYGGNLWAKPHYQHFPFVLLASVLLVGQRLTDAKTCDTPRNRLWIVLAYATAWLLLLLAYQALSPLLAAISFIILAGGWILSLATRLHRSFPIGPWMLLWLLINPPFSLDHRLIESLQRLSSRLSSQALDLFRVHHLMEGNTLVLQDRQLFVDEACSGIISAISIVACAAIYGVWRRRSTLHTILLMLTAMGWAILLNVVRITSIALAHVHLGINWAEGYPHTLLGLTIFSLSLVTLVATDWLLQAVLAEIGARWSALTGEPIVFGKTLVRAWDWITQSMEQETASDIQDSAPIDWQRLVLKAGAFSIGIAPILAFAGLGATQLVRPAWVKSAPFPDTSELASNLLKEVMPQHLLGLTLVNATHHQRSKDSVFGNHSIVFEYAENSGNRYLVSCDFPFAEWHDLSICYKGIGWSIENQTIQMTSKETLLPHESTHEFKQIDLAKPGGNVALVTFCACYKDGEQVVIPTNHEAGISQELLHIFSRREWNQRGQNSRLSYQIQVLAGREEKISDDDRRISEKLLDEARRRFIEVSLKTP